MDTVLIRIGNSKGIRIPAKILESMGFKQKVTLEIIDNYGILIRPADKAPRSGWNKEFSSMHERNEDEMIINESLDIEYLADLEW